MKKPKKSQTRAQLKSNNARSRIQPSTTNSMRSRNAGRIKAGLTRPKSLISILLGLLLSSLALNAYFLIRHPKISDQTIKVIGVIDGDTIVLDGKVRLRLRHVDAPELEYCGGQESKQFLEDLVNDQSVAIREKILDQRGRAMSLIYLGDTLINERVIASGWGRYHSDQSTKRDELKTAGQQAKDQKLGLYGPDCYQTEPPDPKCNIKANIDTNSDRRNYYYPGCPQYQFTIVEKDKSEGWFCTEKEAQSAGFTKAKNCP